jgi:hypothetical protein
MARIRATLVAIAVVAGVAFGGLVAGTVAAPAAGGATPHRAMVVVETGAATYHQVVTFTSDSITGLKALELAGAQPVVYSFAGQGGAVCRLFGVGRDAGPNCLGGADGDNRYWAYFRAPAGSGGFTYSRAGAGSTQVHDGDVEGWKFGTGTAPAYAGLPPVTTTTTRPAVTPPPPVGGSGSSAGGATVAGPSGSAVVPPMNLDPQALAAFLAAASTTTTTLSPPSANRASSRRSATQVEGTQAHRSASGPVPDGSDGGSGAGSLVLFAVVALALVGGGLLLRRSRRRPVP